VPVYVLCGTGKFLTPGYSPPPEPPRPAQEITQLDSSNVAIENFYFEWTPLELVTGIVTEEGLLSPEQVGAQQPVRLHPALMRRRRRLG
jgi:translation initiation factor 2B subunit (eIF-2B alpha/beta/delta family)